MARQSPQLPLAARCPVDRYSTALRAIRQRSGRGTEERRQAIRFVRQINFMAKPSSVAMSIEKGQQQEEVTAGTEERLPPMISLT